MSILWLTAMVFFYLDTPYWVKVVFGLFIGIDIAIAYKKAYHKNY